MNLLHVIKSKEDVSTNFIFDNGLEARYVQRASNYYIIYVSSQRGCDKSCRFCHLTQTGQTDSANATLDEYIQQVRVVLEYTTTLNLAVDYIHINFMARGEPLANPLFHTKSNRILLFAALQSLIKVPLRFKVSTIMPLDAPSDFDCDIFDVTLYYSYYSPVHAWRKKWIPKAHDFRLAASNLSYYYHINSIPVKLHCAFIEGENDSDTELDYVLSYFELLNVPLRFNIVRYNSFEGRVGKESGEEKIEKLKHILEARLGKENVKLVPRVGQDVFASCGQFFEAKPSQE